MRVIRGVSGGTDYVETSLPDGRQEGAIRNTGDPEITGFGQSGCSERGQTRANCYNGIRESDHFIVVLNRRRTEDESWKFEEGERRGVLDMELCGKNDKPYTDMVIMSTRNLTESRRRLRVTCPEEPDEGKPHVRICEGEWKFIARYAYNEPHTAKA